MSYEVRKDFNQYLGYFVEIEPIEPHPSDCKCVECKPRPPRQYREYDELDTKQDRLFWR